MAHVFISYSKQNIDFARHLRDLLTARGIGVWLDESRLTPSSRWWNEIEDNIERCAALIVVMTPAARESDWVEREILYAERLDKPIFPVLLEGDEWPRLANLQYADMRAGLQATLPPRLEHRLSMALKPPRSAAPSFPQPDAVKPPRTARRRAPRSRVFGCLRTGRRVIIMLMVLVLLLLVASNYEDWFGSDTPDDSPRDTVDADQAREEEAPPDDQPRDEEPMPDLPPGGWFEIPFDDWPPPGGWDHSDNWHVADGFAELSEGGHMFLPAEFDDMLLNVRLWWETNEGQMGIVFRAAEEFAYVFAIAPGEIRLDQTGPETSHTLAAMMYEMPPGWHEITILALGEEVQIMIDGELVIFERINDQRGGVGLYMDGYGWLQLDHFVVLPP